MSASFRYGMRPYQNWHNIFRRSVYNLPKIFNQTGKDLIHFFKRQEKIKQGGSTIFLYNLGENSETCMGTTEETDEVSYIA